jgi:tetratricopeptide (TPR) repeat protein
MAFFSSFTKGLYPGEVILLILGVVLFVVLVIAFLYQLMHQRSLAALLGFFLLPVVMIGYPTITSLQYGNGVLTVQKTTDQLLNNPADPQSRQALEQQIQQIAPRASSNPADTVTLAKAQFALGHEADAAQNLQKALQAKADLPEALALKTKMEVAQNLQRLAAQVEQEPSNQQARTDLQKNIAAAAQLRWANPSVVTSLAQAQTALGDHAAALKTINTAVAIDPTSAPALKLKETIAMRAAAPPHS